MDGPWFACPACGCKEFELAAFFGKGVEPFGGLAECLDCGAQFRDGKWWDGSANASVSKVPLVLNG